jgi:hypothetical protein
MQDDVTRGAGAPIEADGSGWLSEPEVSRQSVRIAADEVRVGLRAVVLSVAHEQPVVLVAQPPPDGSRAIDSGEAAPSWRLPAARFSPPAQQSLEAALRQVVHQGAGRELGYLEQLLTDYGPLGRGPDGGAAGAARQLSVSYLALTRADTSPLATNARWVDCYEQLPWEDFRGGRPTVLTSQILPCLEAWCAQASDAEACAWDSETPMSRSERVAVSFGLSGRSWDDQRVVDRLDLVLEAGLLSKVAPTLLCPGDIRLVAAGLGRLRAKIRYRPVVFELLPTEFTLFELQRTVEAVLGPTLHKQNFRRLVEGTGLVEPTGEVRNNTGGRPAKTFRFRREVLLERPAPGVHVRAGRAA